MTFFRVVKEQPEALIESFEWELVSRSEYERLANLEPDQLTPVQRAHRFYYLIMAGWGGELYYPLDQTKCQWILSSYDTPEIHELFARHLIISVQSFSGMKVERNKRERVVNREVLITNFEPHPMRSLSPGELSQATLMLENEPDAT